MTEPLYRAIVEGFQGIFGVLGMKLDFELRRPVGLRPQRDARHVRKAVHERDPRRLRGRRPRGKDEQGRDEEGAGRGSLQHCFAMSASHTL